MVNERKSEGHTIRLFSYIITTFFAVICFLPFLRVVAQAFSSEIHVLSGEVGLFPIDFTTEAFKFVLDSNQFTGSLKITVFATFVFTVLAMVLTILTAYPLSRHYLKGVRGLNFFVIFTMLFNGGIIPTYLVVKNIGIMNSFWALIIPNAISAYNIILLVSFMRTLPIELEESAKIEGASQYSILIRIMIPLSKPILATLLLFYAVARWNMWFDVVMYINNSELYTLQVVLRNLLMSTDNSIMKTVTPHESPLVSVQAASVIFTVLPIVVLYPFLQKYFVKGIVLGGVKG